MIVGISEVDSMKWPGSMWWSCKFYMAATFDLVASIMNA
jgi:hypothetical protein